MTPDYIRAFAVAIATANRHPQPHDYAEVVLAAYVQPVDPVAPALSVAPAAPTAPTPESVAAPVAQ